MSKKLACVICILVFTAECINAQGIEINLDGGNELNSSAIQLFLLITVLSLAPGILVTLTCFPFIITVLSILRQAIGLQQAPPNLLLVSLALFLTYFVMEPTFALAWANGVEPYLSGDLEMDAAFQTTVEPFREFMLLRVDPDTLKELSNLRIDQASDSFDENPPLSALLPSFLLSEISRAFQVGFLVFLPFLIIDLVVAAILMSMGMMMVPPAIVSLPFKLAFFVFADGWALISGSLVRSYY